MGSRSSDRESKPPQRGSLSMIATDSIQLWWKRRILPGFGLTLGFTLLYISLIVLIPLSATFAKASGLGWEAFFRAASSPRVLASYQVTFGISLFAAAVNAVFGGVLAWALVRYRFPGRKLLDAMVDLPFALPTAVAGIALAAIYSPMSLPLSQVSSTGWSLARKDGWDRFCTSTTSKSFLRCRELF